jgi:hypothetical protein
MLMHYLYKKGLKRIILSILGKSSVIRTAKAKKQTKILPSSLECIFYIFFYFNKFCYLTNT